MNYILVLCLIAFSIFVPVFTNHEVPFPGNYLVAWYEPFKTVTSRGASLGIAHKAVADDVFRHIYPMKLLASDLMRRGQFPLWNPYNGAGEPLLAVLHPGFFNPFSFLMNVFPPMTGWSFYIIFQELLLVIFMYAYGRSIRLAPFAAMIGAVTLGFSGLVLARLIYGDYLYSLAGLLVLLVLFERRRRGRRYAVFLIPFVTAFMIVSVQPQITMYLFLFFVLYVLAFTPQWKTVLGIAGLLGLGAGISAFQMLPTLELYFHANVTAASSAFIFDRFLLPIGQFVTVAIPNYFGNQGTYNWWGTGDYTETVMSFGLIPLYFAALSVLSRKYRRLVWFGFGMIALTILFALDWPFTHALYRIPLPVISTSIPTRIFILTTLAVSMLAAIGAQRFAGSGRGTRVFRVVSLFSAGIAGILAITFIAYLRHWPCPSIEVWNCRTVALRNTVFEGGIFLAVMSTVAVLSRLGKRTGAVTGIILLLALIGLGCYNAGKIIPFSARDRVFPEAAPFTALVHAAGVNRVFGIGQAAIPTDFATQYRFSDPDYYDPLYIRRYGELVSFANTGSRTGGLLRSDVILNHEAAPGAAVAQRRDRLLDILGVSMLLYKTDEVPVSGGARPVWQDADWYIRRRPTAYPRAFLVNHSVVERGPDRILKTLLDPSFSPRTTAILEADTGYPVDERASGSATIRLYTPNSIEITTRATGSTLLVLSDTYYPGWRAAVDGHETPIYRADYAFRAIRIDGGTHSVRFFYAPDSFRYGVYLSLVSIVVACTLFLVRSRRYGKIEKSGNGAVAKW
ncbi:YfhO family protein [Patescibacteria group bacterium]|nr:YfhO family protein [Patescibacteria group bacterium]